MSRSEALDLARIHSRKMERLTSDLTTFLQQQQYLAAGELLFALQDEIQTAAACVAMLIGKEKKK